MVCYKRRGFIIIIMAPVFVACMHSKIFNDNPESYKYEIENESAQKPAVIMLRNNESKNVRSIKFEDKYLKYRDVSNDSMGSCPISEVQSIRFINKGMGAAEGAGIGLLIGAGIGALVGGSSGSDPPGWFSMSAEDKAFAAGAIGGLFGILLGLPTGYGTGSKFVYKFKPGAVKIDSVIIPIKGKK